MASLIMVYKLTTLIKWIHICQKSKHTTVYNALNENTCRQQTKWFPSVILTQYKYTTKIKNPIRPYKINSLVLGPIFPIFDAGGRHFFFYYCKVYRNDAGGIFFSNMTKIWYTNTWKNNSWMDYYLFFSCFIGNYIKLSFAGYRDCSVGCRNNQ
jgi:hypothetical protein